MCQDRRFRYLDHSEYTICTDLPTASSAPSMDDPRPTEQPRASPTLPPFEEEQPRLSSAPSSSEEDEDADTAATVSRTCFPASARVKLVIGGVCHMVELKSYGDIFQQQGATMRHGRCQAHCTNNIPLDMTLRASRR